MKYACLVADGMADYPLKELGDRTPLEAAQTPHMDRIAREGILGRVRTIPGKMSPASDVANLSILGYDPSVHYTGRGPLEAANLGVILQDEDVAFRCNLVTASSDTLVDYSAGHISTKEAMELLESVSAALSSDEISFHPGVSYRHLMVVRNGTARNLHQVQCRPPHDIMGQSISRNLPKGDGAEFIASLMQESRRILAQHEINQVRVDLRENPATMIWLWGQGRKPRIPLFKEQFGVTASMISAVDLLRGLGRILGMEPVLVPGATAYYDTNYEGKGRAAIEALQKKDFVFVHLEASDEASHNGDLREKILAIERFDRHIVGPLLEAFGDSEHFRVMVLPDHATPIALRTHVSDPVLFCLYGAGIAAGGANSFCEREAQASKLFFEKGHELMPYFITS